MEKSCVKEDEAEGGGRDERDGFSHYKAKMSVRVSKRRRRRKGKESKGKVESIL